MAIIVVTIFGKNIKKKTKIFLLLFYIKYHKLIEHQALEGWTKLNVAYKNLGREIFKVIKEF